MMTGWRLAIGVPPRWPQPQCPVNGHQAEYWRPVRKPLLESTPSVSERVLFELVPPLAGDSLEMPQRAIHHQLGPRARVIVSVRIPAAHGLEPRPSKHLMTSFAC